MKAFFTAVIVFTSFISPLLLKAQPETAAGYDARMEWWSDARFGMFIHWGLYAVPAGEWKGKTEYGEWIRTSAEIPLDEYSKFVEQFNPVKFNALEWVRMAKEAGMKYIVITSKHHDGFCMFDTKQTDFCIMSTPFHKDPMKDLADACRKEGMKLCFYYSIMDWHHPDWTPRLAWEKDRPVTNVDFSRYMSYMKAELKELLTNYGDIGILWFDGDWETTWNAGYGKEIYDYCRSIQPGIIINNRITAGKIELEGPGNHSLKNGDYGTPEQEIPATGIPGVNWETCMTMNDHWGYNKHDHNFKSTKEIIRMLCDIASKGGNYLLNVGPTAEGVFPQESIDRLHAIGEWMKTNGDAIYGSQASPFRALDWGRCTTKGVPGRARLYLHVFNWPQNGILQLPGCMNNPIQAWLLADPQKTKLTVTREEDALMIQVPREAPDTICSVIVLDLQGNLDINDPPVIKADFGTFVHALPVQLVSDRDSVDIYYTMDGTSPTASSLLYTKPFTITQSAVITARCFRNGRPVSGNNTREFTKETPWSASTPNVVLPGVGYSYYEGSWDSVPVFNTLKAVKSGTLVKICFDPRRQNEFFAFDYSGWVLIPAEDVYSFYTESDDGSRLFIDGKLIVDNDGLHSLLEREGTVPLAEGYHSFRISYFNKTGSFDLNVSIRSPILKKQMIPGGMLFH
jgi:alpha-L-fucosidase